MAGFALGAIQPFMARERTLITRNIKMSRTGEKKIRAALMVLDTRPWDRSPAGQMQLSAARQILLTALKSPRQRRPMKFFSPRGGFSTR